MYYFLFQIHINQQEKAGHLTPIPTVGRHAPKKHLFFYAWGGGSLIFFDKISDSVPAQDSKSQSEIVLRRSPVF